MNILFKTSFAAVLALAAAQSAEAGSKIYTCEINGEIVYTSRASGNCHSADLPSIGRYSSSRYDSPMPSEIRTQPEPQYRPVQKRSAARAGMPKPQPVQQAPIIAAPKSPGNSSRRAILEQELANERRALSDAQKSLAQARGAKGGSIDQQQISTLQSSVLDRQQNIQALQRELGRM